MVRTPEVGAKSVRESPEAPSGSAGPDLSRPSFPPELPAEPASGLGGPHGPVFRQDPQASRELKAIMTEIASGSTEPPVPPPPTSASQEPDAEPPNLKFNEAWSNFSGNSLSFLATLTPDRVLSPWH